MSEQILLLYNPISGKGRSKAECFLLQEKLISEGFKTKIFTAKEYLNSSLKEHPISGFKSLVVAGGDGTILNLLDVISGSDVSLYNLPTGNESLFAREFQMKNSFEQVVHLLRNQSIRSCYVPLANKKPFFCMVSLGFDSEVVSKIAEKRSGTIGHRGYLLPVLKTAISHKPPIISLIVDGKEVVSDEPGFLIVANCKQYALSMPFLPEANSEEKALVARFVPYKNLFEYSLLSLNIFLNRQNLEGSRFFKGEKFFIKTLEPFPAQVDGDYLGNTPIELESTNQKINILAERE